MQLLEEELKSLIAKLTISERKLFDSLEPNQIIGVDLIFSQLNDD